MDFEATIPMEGTATVSLFVSDADCSATRNCSDEAVSCTPVIFGLEPIFAYTYPIEGQFVGLVVKSVMRQ
jgi:hypothetical protein